MNARPAFLALLLAAAAAAPAQDAPLSTGSAESDQEYNLGQIRHIKARMAHLADKCEREGDLARAELLRSAVRLVDEKRIEQGMSEVLQEIRNRRPQVGAASSEEVRAAVAELLALLEQRARDRQADEALARAAEASRRAGELIDRQQKVRLETEERRRRAEEESDPSLAERRKDLDSIEAEQRRLDAEARAAEERAARARRAAEGLREVLERQRSLASDLEGESRAAPPRVAEARRAVAEAAAAAAEDAVRAAALESAAEAVRRARELEKRAGEARDA
ncbi:MAG: hypothetical protein L6R43_16675, partial [Planctomycetes bacterium]|nr:hypothetical protein [Planctomycetota bacterium]